ncbi:monovalent cation/H+ antiporter complex subunit F [Fuchsiella alkaliacetigena]|uniref:monovalent cation/H+ antiporter complex subunit F n=1 Tax=Fuchsiella alkaliacetigena TaxID=957042 RepID=UPI00200AFFA0|nr:monovalent cation/H+ antiporter complex subunit F [Fuchsiella alkaliacetigena]MCK8825632.1 monovalent cation/H+ antiporter complex subunit F [Fuchsiella alkaliacetigena]
MIEYTLLLVLGIVLLSITLTFIRLVKGPTVFDKIAAIDAIGIMILVILILLSIYYDRHAFLDVAFVYGLLLFMSVLILARFFIKKREVEVKED